MRIAKRLIVVLPLLSAACAPTVWQHDPPVSQQQFTHDLSRCNVMGQQMSYGYSGASAGLFALAAFMQERDMCMNGEGWTKVKG